MTLHGFLARLIWACVLPLLLAAAWLAWNSVQTTRAERDQDAADLARGFAAAVDQHLTARIGALAMLAESPLLDDTSRWQDLHREALSFQHSFGSHVILTDGGMHMLFNTRAPFGTPLPMMPHPQGRAAAPAALASGQPAVGDIVFGPVARVPLVAIAVPALRQGKPRHVLLTLFEVRQFQQRLDQFPLPAGWSLSLLDSTGASIARRAPPGFDPALEVDAAGRFEARLTAAPWRVVLEIPRRMRWAPLLSAILTLAATLLGATLLALLGGRLASRRLGKALASLARPPEPGAPPPDIAEIASVRALLDEAAASRAAAVGALSQSEQAYHSLFDNMLNGVVHARVIFEGETPVDLQYIATNPAFATITGITEDVVGRRISEFIPGYCANNPESLETFGKVAASGVPVRWEHYLKELERWFSFIVYAPAPGEVVIVTENITERKQAEAALLDRDFKLSAIVDNSPAVLSLKHPDGRYALANPNLQRIHRQSEQDILGQTDFDLYPAETARIFRANDARVLETMARHAIEEIVPVDGLPRNFMSHMFPVLDAADQARFICRISLDITDRKRAEAEINRLNERITLATRAARVGIWDWDVANDRLLWDEQMYALYGVREEDFSGAVEAWGRGLHPEDRVAGQEESASALRGEGVYDTEFRVQWPDVSEHHLKARADVIRDGEGHPLRMIGVNYDITELKQAEAEIRLLNADLERRVQERTAELTAANRELDSFAYAVSHDLRAPLRAMNGFSQALEEDCASQLPAEGKEFLGQIKLASCRMGDLIDGLLALSRSTRGEMRHDAVDLTALCGRLLVELARNEPDRQVAAHVAPGLAARGDERMIEAVMRNLLGNAWKYSVHAAAPVIRVYAEEQDGTPRFCVTDNGAGFDMAHASRLFQPFQRLHRQDEFPGLGIGLATVQRIVHRHGGTVDATGAPGRGATFCFSLPGLAGKSSETDKEPS